MKVLLSDAAILATAVLCWAFDPVPPSPLTLASAAAAASGIIVLAFVRRRETGSGGGGALKNRTMWISTAEAVSEGFSVGLVVSGFAGMDQWNALVLAAASVYLWHRSTNSAAEVLPYLAFRSLCGSAAYLAVLGRGEFLTASAALLFIPPLSAAIRNSRRLGSLLRRSSNEPSELSKKAYDHMLATLAHEIRTPLTIMQTTENVLLEQIPGPLNERQKQFLESVYMNTQRLIAFSENMLTLIKIEDDWKPDLSKNVDLRVLTKQVVDTVRPMLDMRRQHIKYSFPSLLAKPKADEAWIRQVLINLVHNASKHTEENGVIIISCTQDDKQVVVTVTDNGLGVVGEGRELLFKEFYQERSRVETYQDGFGLGLSIVRSIIQKHRGDVYITSSKDLGTMVSFNLPAEAIE